MVFQSNGQFGSSAFLRAYHRLPILQADRPAAIARWLGVSVRTVHDWINGRRCPPRAAVLALWLESFDGQQAMHTQLFNESRTHAAHARSLGEHVARLTATIDSLRSELAQAKAGAPGAHLSANDGAFYDAPAPRPPSRQRA